MESDGGDGAHAPLRRVWDVPVRISHWLLAASVAGAWLTRSAELIDAHAFFGYCATALVAFRVAWGFVGTRHARFRDFAYSPRDAASYLRDALRGRARHYTGHNPAGSFAVYLMLAAVAGACVTGLIALGGMHAMGPLAGATPGDDAIAAAWLWHEYLAWVVLALALLHLAGVAWGSRVHRENLAGAMISGRKRDHSRAAAEVRGHRALGAAIAVAAAAAGATYLLAHAPRERAKLESRETAARARLAATAWEKECGSCHLAYPPALLPMRSWQRTLDEQDRHFGEDLSLAPPAVARLLEEARAQAAPGWAARMLAASVAAQDAPLRVTELAQWRRWHERLERAELAPPRVAGPHECDGCHADAHSGTFHPRMIRKAKPRVPS